MDMNVSSNNKFYKIIHHVNQGYGNIDRQTVACVCDSQENVKQFIKDMNKEKRSDYFTYEEMFRTLDDLRKVYLGEP